MKRIFLAALIAVVALSFLGCSGGDDSGSNTGPRAEAPFINVQPGDYQLMIGDTVQLGVEASVTDGGSLSYQWYSATAVGRSGTPIDGAKSRVFSPPTETAGRIYYYVEVSNSKEETRTSTRSRYATLFVVDPAAAPSITGTQYYIAVDENGRQQYIHGFGGMINAWGSSPDMTVADADMLFNPDKLGLNILRYIIYPEPLEEIMNNLHYTNIDNSDLFDIGKVVNKYGGMIMGCPWTPPDGIKLVNGHLDPTKYMDMARHLVTWVNKMETGMGGNNKVHALSSQNEPDSNASWGIYSKEENRDFVKATFPWIKQQIPNVLLFPGEWTNFDEELYMPIVEDPAALAAVDGFAGHFYGTITDASARKERLLETGKYLWMTEHLRNTNNNKIIDATWAQVWSFADDFHNTMINGFNAYIYWYAKRWYGLIGDSEPGVTNQRDGQPLLRGLLMSHYAKYAAGKYRYDANWMNASFTATANQPANARVTAYMDDKTITMVMLNRSTLASGRFWITVKLPAPVESGFAIITYNEGGPAPNNSAVDSTTRAQVPTQVVFSEDKQTASVLLEPSSFLSVRFYK
jgi:glucuronoarabinoxylan endo-1,4-beta-xylanase